MIAYDQLPGFLGGFIGICVVLLLFGAVMDIILEIKHRHFPYVPILTIIAALLYVVFQCICDIRSDMRPIYSFLNDIEDYISKMPICFFILMILGIMIIEVYILSRNKKWEQDNITPSSIKEAVDNLPVGICCYESNGQVMIKNIMMENICLSYTGESLLNAIAFGKAVYSDKEHTEDVIIMNKDNGDKVFSISDKPFSDDKSMFRVMTATDITEQYENTRSLKEHQDTVIKLNKELSDYGKQIVSSITAREVLNAKVKLHDELGANLLAIKRYILNGGSLEERIAIENILRKNLQYLKNETEMKEKDEYAVILETAEKLDMKVKVMGELTEMEPQRHVIVTGIHECLTNAIRHAGGDELTVVLEEDTDMFIAKFTNNGKAPENEIKERGGLALLKALTEESKGTMQILSKPRFELILKIPKKETRRVI